MMEKKVYMKELNEKDLLEINGGGDFGKCVVGAWGAGIVGAFAGWEGGPIGMGVAGLAGEIAYMGSNGCF